MRALKSILVALDGSSSGYHALEESIRLAHWARAGITAIAVAPPYEGDLSLVGVKDIKAAMDGPCEEVLDEALDIAEAYSVRMNVILEEGAAHEKILLHAEREGSDLIVLGTRGSWSLSRVFLGSVTSRVFENSPRDILAIPENAAIGWEKMLLVADDSQYGKSAVALAAELAAVYGSELKVAPGDGTGRGSFDELEGWARRSGIACEILVEHALPLGAVKDFAGEHGVKLTILGFEPKRGIRRFITGCPVDRLVCSSCCPVLVVRARHEWGAR